ncbi:hypothetical protein BIW11_02977 [Tropilaelaps mercedesae]|uniref:Uncharacterized protein n=1 Tax=Tropilaelaps mercedesae TaxID=418985 RepID=A0A1V9XU01_9ACAR|nr:hypothetical protein BIW11_02977 [Tropilaelaps mercedesae]
MAKGDKRGCGCKVGKAVKVKESADCRSRGRRQAPGGDRSDTRPPGVSNGSMAVGDLVQQQRRLNTDVRRKSIDFETLLLKALIRMSYSPLCSARLGYHRPKVICPFENKRQHWKEAH